MIGKLMQRLLNPIYCSRSDCRIRGCIYFSKVIKQNPKRFPEKNMNMTRREMINRSMGDFLASGAGVEAFDRGISSTERQASYEASQADDFYRRIVRANDARVPALIESVNAASPRRAAVRRVAGDLQALAAAFCAPESSFHKAGSLVAPMEKA